MSQKVDAMLPGCARVDVVFRRELMSRALGARKYRAKMSLHLFVQ